MSRAFVMCVPAGVSEDTSEASEASEDEEVQDASAKA